MEELELLGPVTVACGPEGLQAVLLGPAEAAVETLQRRFRTSYVEAPSELGSKALGQLREYAAGQRTRFDLPLAPPGTPFQQEVWRAVSEIPYGTTRTYSGIAAGLGRPRAFRAVGAANGANPLCVIVPCHRVIGASGGLTGYAYGLPLKERLLALEARTTNR
jgi:methylated-DNA-[protein]-cysteine S-methyltransferase